MNQVEKLNNMSNSDLIDYLAKEYDIFLDIVHDELFINFDTALNSVVIRENQDGEPEVDIVSDDDFPFGNVRIITDSLHSILQPRESHNETLSVSDIFLLDGEFYAVNDTSTDEMKTTNLKSHEPRVFHLSDVSKWTNHRVFRVDFDVIYYISREFLYSYDDDF